MNERLRPRPPFWLGVAWLDLFPAHRLRRRLPAIHWLPGLCLILAAATAVAIGICFDAASRGARAVLEDPEALRKLAVFPPPLSTNYISPATLARIAADQPIAPAPGGRPLLPDDWALLRRRRLLPHGPAGDSSALGPEARELLRRVEDVYPYHTLATGVYAVGAGGQKYPRSAIRTARLCDPVLRQLRPATSPGAAPGSEPLFPFADEADWGIVASKGLLEKLGLLDALRPKLEAFARRRDAIGRDQSLGDDRRRAALARLDAERRPACTLTLEIGETGSPQRCAIPLHGIVEYIPGAPRDQPELLVLESFVADLHASRLQPNPPPDLLVIEGLSLDEVAAVRTLTAPPAGEEPPPYQLRWAPPRIAVVRPERIEELRRASPESRVGVVLNNMGRRPLPEVLGALRRAGVDVEGRYRAEGPRPRLLTGARYAAFHYADVYLKPEHQDQYERVALWLRDGVGVSCDLSQYDNVMLIRDRLAFMRRAAARVLALVNLAAAAALLALQMLLAHFRVKEMAVLRASGAGAGLIALIYGTKGLIIWALGAALGAALAAAAWWGLVRGGIEEALRARPPDSALLDALGSAWWPAAQTFLACVAGAMLACLFALMISSPAKVIRQ